jgi:3-hydroxyisobutyrate dehydrogenase-like beta-hydroxyacid dehydrogenase
MQEVAFLGLGLLGSALARGAVARGEHVVVWNRSPEKARAFAQDARVATSVTDAVAGAKRVHLTLTDDTAVDGVLDQFAGIPRTCVVIDHSTTSPSATAERARRMAAQACAFLHAPVFMSPAMALAREGSMLVCGPQQAFEIVEPALRAMTSNLEYLGERADLAAAHKLVAMSLILACTAGMADALALAVALNVPATEAHARLTKTDLNAVVLRRGLSMVQRDFRASVDVATVRKDTLLELAAAADAQIPVPTLSAVAARLDELIARGHAADDIAVLAIDALPRTLRQPEAASANAEGHG